ncbi:glycosyl hydrolase [Spirosoma fluviale]|uniref:Alpha-L-rhamnosidase n=1 Tax=Spirosoma fluviale TaxID=1597977 RepID=A0A286GUX4_9BACT|nr:glycosyl hydrolase [Spirosoma fluviale]SOD99290.1 alpha-L-rhamnosidase [Spirosoma fluviale]
MRFDKPLPRIVRIILLASLLVFIFNPALNAQNGLSKTDFRTPPQSSKVHTWWHWMAGYITKEGITKDLESMKRQGIVQASLINVGDILNKKVDVPQVKFNSPEWIAMFQWALKEANRLGITIGIQTIDGYATSGGPWITPDLSMKEYVWSKTVLEGGKNTAVKLPQPLQQENFYRDVAVVAYPMADTDNSFQKAWPTLMVNARTEAAELADGNPKTAVKTRKGDVIDIKLPAEFTANKLVVMPYLPFCWDDMGKIEVQFILSGSMDGKTYTNIANLSCVGVNKSITLPFPTTRAKFFRLQLAKTNFLYFSEYPIGELELLTDEEPPAFNPQLTSFFEKAASVFDVSQNALDANVKLPATAISENAIVDVTRFLSADGTLNWNAPNGRWQVIRFGYTSTGVKTDPSSPEGLGLEADKMDTTALSVHFNSYAKKLIQAAGSYVGNTLKFVLMDSWEAHFQTWSKTFPDEFKARRGYSIVPWLPVLCGEVVGNQQLSEAFLHDFRKTIADLIDQNHYKHFRELCHQNRLELHGEAIYSNWGAYPPLDPLKANQYMDLPMTEFWAENNKDNLGDYKPANRPTPGFPMYSALAHGKQVIGSEAYTNFAHYSEAPFDLKPFGDAAYCSGVNQLIMHSFVHQPVDKKPGMTLGKFGAHFNRNNPWWVYNQDWLTYQARVQYVLQQGEPLVDVLFYAGDQLPQFFSKSFLSDLPIGIQANACNRDMLMTKIQVTDGQLSLGGTQRFAVLMLPNSTKMELATLKRIAQLVNEGAVVYGPKPLDLLSVPEIKQDSAEFVNLVQKLWGQPGQMTSGKGRVIWGKPIQEMLANLSVLPDLTTNRNDPKEIMYIHRKLGDTDVYYVFNQQDKALHRELLFRVTGKTPELWNAENGTVTKPLIYSVEKKQTRLPISLKPYESKLIVFTNKKPGQFIHQVSRAGRVIFPQQPVQDSTVSIPHASVHRGKYSFVASTAGEYTFTQNNGTRITKQIAAPTRIALGDFRASVAFAPVGDEIIKPLELTSLKSLTEFDDPAIKYFAGKAAYSITFTVPENVLSTWDSLVLNLGNVSATAEVRLNGKVIAYAWQPNTNLVVSGLLRTTNKLDITVATVCRNRIIGDLIQYGQIKSLWTTSPVETILNKNMPLKPSGLAGPLTLTRFARL